MPLVALLENKTPILPLRSASVSASQACLLSVHLDSHAHHQMTSASLPLSEQISPPLRQNTAVFSMLLPRSSHPPSSAYSTRPHVDCIPRPRQTLVWSSKAMSGAGPQNPSPPSSFHLARPPITTTIPVPPCPLPGHGPAINYPSIQLHLHPKPLYLAPSTYNHHLPAPLASEIPFNAKPPSPLLPLKVPAPAVASPPWVPAVLETYTLRLLRNTLHQRIPLQILVRKMMTSTMTTPKPKTTHPLFKNSTTFDDVETKWMLNILPNSNTSKLNSERQNCMNAFHAIDEYWTFWNVNIYMYYSSIIT